MHMIFFDCLVCVCACVCAYLCMEFCIQEGQRPVSELFLSAVTSFRISVCVQRNNTSHWSGVYIVSMLNVCSNNNHL